VHEGAQAVRSRIVSLAALAAISTAAAAQQYSAEQLQAEYLEAAATHNGFVYTVHMARFDGCAEAEKFAAQLALPQNRLRPLRQQTRAAIYNNRFLFAMPPELREQVRTMRERERTGVIKLASGVCLVAEVVDRRQQPMPPPDNLIPMLPPVIERGELPSPDALEKDAKLRMRTFANRIRSVDALEKAGAGFDIDTRLSDGYTVLTRALLLDQADLARAAVKRGANPNLCGPMFCPLELALGLRSDDQAWELLGLLLGAGADPNQLDRAQRTRLVPLAAAARKGPRFAERLVKAGAKPNGIPQATPPIYIAAVSGRQDVVEYLMAQGADPFAPDTSRPGARNTAWVAARESRNPAFIEWMEKRMVGAAAKSGKHKLEAWIEQDGRRLAASGELRLKRAPFRVVARLADPAGVGLLVASAQSSAFQDDVKRKNAESAIFRPASTGAEDEKSDWLYVLAAGAATKNAGIQYWYWESERERRFSGVREAGGAKEYYKDIRSITLAQADDKTQEIPLAKYGGDLYLVLAAPVYFSAFEYRFIEPQFVRIRFE
jgi:hypothetical protein